MMLVLGMVIVLIISTLGPKLIQTSPDKMAGLFRFVVYGLGLAFIVGIVMRIRPDMAAIIGCVGAFVLSWRVGLFQQNLHSRLAVRRQSIDPNIDTRPDLQGKSGSMSEQEAYELLGLEPGASERRIRAAHHRLMKKVHPDKGGSTFLASRVNEARDLCINAMIRKHRSTPQLNA